MPRPFVSVITPTYKRRNFLPILIHLYQQQTYPKELRELVILDDSPESNQDLIPKNDKSIKYHYLPEKIPLGEKRNRLNELAKGDIIVCFDDDDYHYPERVSHSVFKLEKERTQIAGCSKLSIYYTDINKIYSFGPFGQNHGTNGSFAYRKSYIKNHKHDPTKHAQEEPSFTNDFKEPMSQLDDNKIILCISHSSNTFDKKFLLKQDKNLNHIKIQKIIKDKVYLEFLKKLAADINTQAKEKAIQKLIEQVQASIFPMYLSN
jgi:glycosyltransferase involved in cell wall biosynthesis